MGNAASAAVLGSQLVWIGVELDKAFAAAEAIRRALGESPAEAWARAAEDKVLAAIRSVDLAVSDLEATTALASREGVMTC
jgi:hypothetical protein